MGVLELEMSGNPVSIIISFPYLFLKTLLCTYAKLRAGSCTQMAGNVWFFFLLRLCNEAEMKQHK